MKVIVTGVTGQLGYDTARVLRGRGEEVVGATRREIPLDDPARARTFVEETRPDAVIHCAAYTAVDAAEDNVELYRKINRDGTQNIANTCKKHNIKMIYIDYLSDYLEAMFLLL